MMKGKNALITLDVINEYIEILDERVQKALASKNMRIFVGDFVEYTLRLFENNGWSPKTDSPDEFLSVLNYVLNLCFSANGISGIKEWSNDMSFIVVY